MSTEINYIAAYDLHGSLKRAAEAVGVSRTTFFDRLNVQRNQLNGILNPSPPRVVQPRTSKDVLRFILTSAVVHATAHTDFLHNLQAYANSIGATLVVGPLDFPVGNSGAVAAPAQFADFDLALEPYLSDTPIVMGDRVRFSPECRIKSTVKKPLLGFRTLTKYMWGIFPHPRVSLDTVSTDKETVTKQIMTTGCVTLPNYSETASGVIAHHHHILGALIVEVTRKGAYCRHVTPTDATDGTFYDVDKKVQDGKVTLHDGVAGIVYGDIHIEFIDEQVFQSTWGNVGSLTNALRPEYQVFHDLMDMKAINHHEIDDIIEMHKTKVAGRDDIEGACASALAFLNRIVKMSKHVVVVESNHEAFVKKWINKHKPKSLDFDKNNIWARLYAAIYAAVEAQENLMYLPMVLKVFHPGEPSNVVDKVRWLTVNERFLIQNVQCAWHGHLGPNGAKGSKASFKDHHDKSIIGHFHTPYIDGGSYVVGTSSKMDLGYNQGLSNWAHTHCVIYPHGGRALLTMSDGKFWADQ